VHAPGKAMLRALLPACGTDATPSGRSRGKKLLTTRNDLVLVGLVEGCCLDPRNFQNVFMNF